MTGEILFSVQTFMGARLIEYIADDGICIRGADMPDDHTIHVWVSGRDEKAFCALMERFHLPYSVLTVRGRAKVKKCLREHWVLAVGLVSGILLVYALSLRVWLIDVKNAPDGMRESLNRLNVSSGIKKSAVDVNALSRLLEAEYPQYSHIGVGLSGVVLKINCVMAEKAPGVYEIGEHRNLVAKADGVIESIDVFAGQAQVKPGDTVFKGDILISGEERAGKDGEVTPVRAQGTVNARVWTKGESAVNLNFQRTVRTGNTKNASDIVSPFFEIRLSGENPFSAFETETQKTSLVGLFFPVRLVKTTFYELKTESASIKEDEAEKIAFENALCEALQKAPEGAAETRQWAEYKKTNEDKITCTAVVEWIMDIAADGQGG